MAVQGKYLSLQEDTKREIYRIRREVFVKEQYIQEESEFEEADQNAIHALVYEGIHNIRAVATGRLIISGQVGTIEKIAVLKEDRQKKYGEFILRMLIDKAKVLKCNDIYVVSPSCISEFFRKYGFYLVEQECKCRELNYQKMKYDNRSVNKCCIIE